MSDQQINISIAEECGWAHPSVKPYAFPDYCRDLNAMHEAVNTLNEEQKEKYFFNLMCVFGNWPKAIQSNARQRAEAFLRALGKWKEAAK